MNVKQGVKFSADPRNSADFCGILVIPEISVNLDLKACMGGGGYLRNYLTYKDGSPIKIFRILLGNYWGRFCNCFSMKSRSNLWYFGGTFSKIQAKIARSTNFQPQPKSHISLPGESVIKWCIIWHSGITWLRLCIFTGLDQTPRTGTVCFDS